MDSMPGPPLAERADVHKSCKSIETLLSVFNDYCEAAGAVVNLQKKLAKALKETASLKVTGEIAANVLNASAQIFEASSEIDAKFAKHVDKEYDGVSSEVKKWFKKLAKEEKAHDERLATANAKIKQAGQVYEKKSKKNARDAGDEHARYIQLISALGPEVSQEKYNHALLITQRHTATTYSVASCVGRVADAEWLRTCEGVRRYSQTIGQLGEWRALCEGGWTGPVPRDLSDPDEPHPTMQDSEGRPTQRSEHDEPPSYRNAEPSRDPTEVPDTPNPQAILSAPRVDGRQEPASPAVSYNQQQQYFSPPFPTATQRSPSHGPPPSSFEPPRPHVDQVTGSVRSLSAFPSPPTHFPPQRQNQSSHSSSASNVSFPTTRRTFDARLAPAEDEQEPMAESPISSNSPEQKFNERPDLPAARRGDGNVLDRDMRGSPRGDYNEREYGVGPSQTRIPEETLPSGVQRIEDLRGQPRDMAAYNEREFGVVSSQQPRTPDSSTGIKRTDSAGSGSVVAAMRTRYSYNAGSSSPPPKDIPRLPLSVNQIASRYQPPDSPTSPRERPSSPPGPRPLPIVDPIAYAREAEASWRDPPVTNNLLSTSQSHDLQPQPQSREPSHAESELRDKEEKLRAREREIEMRAQELERERASLAASARPAPTEERRTGLAPRNVSQHGQSVLRPRERSLSFQQSQLQRPDLASPSSSPPNARGAPPYSGNNGRLGPPPSPSSPNVQRSEDMNDYETPADHAPYCGCERCSAIKYKSPSPTPSAISSSSPHHRPQATTHLRPMQSDKPKGWMRRLSMPIVVTNAFLDGKKQANHTSLSSKVGISSMDSKKNASTTMLHSSITEEGRLDPGAAGIGAGGGRRSYDVGGYGNRSVSNLNSRR